MKSVENREARIDTPVSTAIKRWGIAGRRRFHANCSRCGVRLECVPCSALKGVRVEYFRRYAHLHYRHLCPWICRVLRRSLVEPERSANRRHDRRRALRSRGISSQLFRYKLWWLYLSYGLIGGIGLGFGYIVPGCGAGQMVSDPRGLITGIAVGGFGAGALITAPVATKLIQSVGVLQTFSYLGIAYFVVTVAAGYFMQNPPADWQPAGWSPTATQSAQRAVEDYTLSQALKTWQWWALWLLLFINVSAGISIISQESPMFQELGHLTAIVAASLVGIASIGNAFGRVFWAWLLYVVTRRIAFALMFAVQVALFWFYPTFHSAAVLARLRSSF